MSFTQTPNYSLYKPTINADNDQWGTHLNLNADTLDTTLATFATPASVAAAVAPYANDVGRNLIHNSLFNVAQRGVGPWTVSGYTLDRWQAIVSLDTVSIVQSATSIAADESAYFCLGNTFTGNSGASAYNWIRQPIENIRRLAGKTVTVSFWAWCGAGALKLGVSMDQYFGTGGSPSATIGGIGSTSVTLSTAPTRYSTTIAIPSIASKTLGTNNDHSTYLNLWFSSGATNNANAGGIGVQSGTIALWGVQLEIGSVMTPLEKPDPQQDLAKCQRFYQTGQVYSQAQCTSITGIYVSAYFMEPMRAAPIVTTGANSSINVGALTWAVLTGNTGVVVSAATAASGSFTFNAAFTASADL